ncbi:MAG: hypothetical protein AAGC76_09505 [Luteibacter sp.]|uniref:hypothetical protein n=1 Tax=Luteibacter sp. TaxID=1886636 RepID=UPI002806AE04|nr:hypothetical protein [Luteibacter sp.]MDQ7996076.1 hypothetical protein [Luteibacter sp.]
MTVYLHLGHAIRIMRQESDIRKWGALIDALTPEQQAEVRPWLRVQAKLALRRASSRSQTATSGAFSKTQKMR